MFLDNAQPVVALVIVIPGDSDGGIMVKIYLHMVIFEVNLSVFSPKVPPSAREVG